MASRDCEEESQYLGANLIVGVKVHALRLKYLEGYVMLSLCAEQAKWAPCSDCMAGHTVSHVAPESLVSGGSGWLLSIGEGSPE